MICACVRKIIINSTQLKHSQVSNHSNPMKHLLVKVQSRQFRLLLTVCTVLGVVQSSQAAQIFTWNQASVAANTWNVNANWSPNTASPGSTDAAIFATTGTSGSSATINNVVSVNTTITSLNYNQNGASAFHVTQIPTAVTLTVSGGVTNGGLVLDGALTPTYFTGAGTFAVNGTTFNVVNFGNTGSAALATLDLSGLTNFIYTANSGILNIGEGNQASANRPGAVFTLAGVSNNISAATINFMTLSGGNGGNGSSLINFGTGTNIINVGTFNIATRKNSGSVKFLGATGGLRIRGVSGNSDDTSRANITVGDVNGKTGTTQPNGKLLLAGAGHPVDIKANTVLLGQATGANGSSVDLANGLISFDAGTMDATTINMAVCSTTSTGTGISANGTLNVSNNVAAGTSGNLIVGTGGISLVNATTFTGTGLLNVSGGTVTSAGNIVKTTAAGVGNVSLVNNSTLTMALGKTVGTAAIPLDTFTITNATLHLSVNAAGIGTNITVTTLVTNGANSITIDAIANYTGGTVTFPLIKYGGSDPYSTLTLAPLPAGFTGSLSDNSASLRVDLVITAGPTVTPPQNNTWNGGGGDNNWSTAGNWNGTNINANDTLFFDGTTRLVNNNDTTAGNLYSNLTFNASAGAFILNGNAITLPGNIVNSSANPQAVNLPLIANTNSTFDGGSAGLIIGKGITDQATTGLQTYTLAGTGTLTNLLASTSNGTNTIAMTSAANWTIVDNPSSSQVIVSNCGFNFAAGGTLNFGNAGSAPLLTTLVGGQGTDNSMGDGATTTTFNMVNGTFTMGRRFNTQNGNVNISGGTLNIWNQLQFANSSGANVGILTASGGTLNVASTTGTTAGGTFFLASRGQGTLTVSGSALVECSTLDVSRNAAGATVGSVGVVNLNGGTLQINGKVSTATANAVATVPGTATFNFNGGTLKANSTSGATFQGSTVAPIIPITAVVKSGGAVVQTSNGKGMTIWEPLVHDSGLGGTPDGGLTKNGNDALILGAANTYTGNTTVNGGILALTNTATIDNSLVINIAANAAVDASGRANGTLTLTANQTLKGNGSVTGTLAVGSGATLAEGASVGSLTLGNVLLLSGGTNVVEVSDAAGVAGTGYDTVTVGGNIGVPATSGSPFTVKVVPLSLVNFNNASSYTWTIAAGAVTNFAAGSIVVDTSAFANDLAGGTFTVTTNGTATALVLTFTPDAGPVTTVANYTRTAGLSFKIAIADLVATNWSSAAGYAVVLTNGISSTNGATVSYDATYIYYDNPNNVADLINYTVTDVNPNYRPGDTIHTTAGIINLAVVPPGAGPVVSQITSSGGVVTLNLAGIPNFSYWIQATTNLIDPLAWQVISTNTAGSNGLFQFVDYGATNTPVGIVRAYRLQQAN